MTAEYPGSDLTPFQLAHALNRKLNVAASCSSIRARFDPKELNELHNELLHALAGIRAFRNAFRPVHRLVPECIAHVFHLVSRSFHSTSCGSWTIPYDWFSISHVCRYWRNVSLAFPSIWAIFDTYRPSIARLCLERSKSARLDVRLRQGCPRDLLEALTPHITRLGTLHSQWTSQEHELLVSFLTAVPAPLLAVLKIDVTDAGASPATALISLFESQMPSLKHLALSHFPLDKPTRQFSNLVRLDIRGNHADSAPQMTTFLDFLELSPNLQHISIVFAGPLVDENPPPGRVVPLNHLRRLVMTGCAVRSILTHLSLPRGVHLCIRDVEVDGSQGMISQTLPQSLCHLINLSHVENIMFRRHDTKSCSILGAGPTGSFAVTATNGNDDYPFFARRAFWDVPSTFDRNLRALWVEDFGKEIGKHGQSATLLGAFKQLNKLEVLVLLRCPSRRFFRVLFQDPETTAIVCPLLRTIVIYDDPNLSPLYLLDLARLRKSHGVPFQRITFIVHPTRWLPPQYFAVLKECVEFVQYKVDHRGPQWTDVVNGSF